MGIYTTQKIEGALETNGELLVVLGSDHYPEPVELHLHDTSFDHDNGEVILDLSDGTFGFSADSVEAMSIHLSSTEDLGL